MKVFSFSETKQRLVELLGLARTKESVSRRKGGDSFSVRYRRRRKSPFDVPSISTNATTQDIIDAVRESRQRDVRPGDAKARK